MAFEVEQSQANFLRDGGVLVRALSEKYKSGELARPGEYEHQEYPKWLHISKGFEDVEHVTEDIKGRTLKTVKNKEVFESILVDSEEEEERVLAGGMTSDELEEERLNLIQKCRNIGIKPDVNWTTIRLKRELGEKMDAPEPKDELSELQAKLDALTKMAQMKAQIEALQAQLDKPADDLDAMRADLVALGVTPDKRWGAVRLREELDRATADQG